MADSRPTLWPLGAFLSALAFLPVAGCANIAITTKAAAVLQDHYILVHPDGYPIRALSEADRETQLTNAPLKPREFAENLDRIAGAIDRRAEPLVHPGDAVSPGGGLSCLESPLPWPTPPTLRRPRDQDPLRILLFVHGGLNGYSDNFLRIKRLLSSNPDKGVLGPNSSYYPIFINWNADLVDSIVDDVLFIRQGQRRGLVEGILTAPFVLLGRAAGSVFGAPVAWARSADTYRDATKEMETTDLLVDLATSAIPWLPARALTTPVVEAFGTPAWQIMKRRAQLAAASRLRPNEAAAEEGAARSLIRCLRNRVRLAADGRAIWILPSGQFVPVEVTLVGHSMGAIMLNRLLAIAGATLRIKRIVYLAPAAGVDEVDSFVTPYLRLHPETAFWWFTLTRVDEATESYVIAPRGTLLAWIDSFFEPAKTVGQSTLGRARNFGEYYKTEPPDGTQDFELQTRRPGVFKTRYVSTDRAPVPPRRVFVYVIKRVGDELPAKHGDFDEPRFFGEVLCEIDSRAFRSPDFCTKTVKLLRPRPKRPPGPPGP